MNLCTAVPTTEPDNSEFDKDSTWWALCSPGTNYRRTYKLANDPQKV